MLKKKKALLSKVISGAVLAASLITVPAWAAIGEPEKEDLKFGFIKLTDMAP